MKPLRFIGAIILLFLLFCLVVGQARGQVVTDTVYKTGTYQYPVITITTTVTKFDTIRIAVKDTIRIHDTTYVYVGCPCDSTPVDTIAPPQTDYIVQSMYVSPIADWIDNADTRLAWAKREGVNELNLYARAYITSTSKHSTLASFVKKAKEQYGIKKVFVDYRLTSEIPYWQAYHNKYKGTSSALDGMITEREPYVTGDYTGFWPFLREGKDFAKANGLLLAVYMGHPKGWDSIVYYADKVYLSLYISMSTWGNSTNGYNYVKGRWEYITSSASKQGKTNYPVIYIISLEQKKWGASNDFMGLWFESHSFFGSTWETLLSKYNSNATSSIKEATDLVGSCMFYSKYGVLARP